MAPVSETRILFCSPTEEDWSSRKKTLKKLLRRLKRRFTVHHADYPSLEKEPLTSKDLIVLFCCGNQLRETLIHRLLKFINKIRGSLLIFPDKDEETERSESRFAINNFLQTFSITFEPSAAFSLGTSDLVQHPRHLYLREPDYLSQSILASVTKGLLIPSAAALNVLKPSIAILKTDQSCFPAEQPIGAVWHQDSAGFVVVLGCSGILLDSWIDQEGNYDYIDHLFSWLTAENLSLPKELCSAPLPSTSQKLTSDLRALAEMPKYCPGVKATKETLQFDWSLFQFDFRHVSEVEKLRADVNVVETELSIIAPQFLTPTRHLRPAHFRIEGPQLNHPSLELFNLDEEVRDKTTQLDRLYRKNKNPIAFVEQAAGICQLDGSSPQEVVLKALDQIVSYKK